MKKYLIKIFALGLAAVLGVSVLASCGEKIEKTETSEPSQTMQDKEQKETKHEETTESTEDTAAETE